MTRRATRRPGRRAVLRISFVFALAAFAPSASWAQDEEQEIIDTLVAMWAAIEAGDLDAYARYVHPDFTAFGENDVYLAEGRALELRSYGD